MKEDIFKHFTQKCAFFTTMYFLNSYNSRYWKNVYFSKPGKKYLRIKCPSWLKIGACFFMLLVRCVAVFASYKIEKIITLNFYITHVHLFNPRPPSFLKVYFYLYYCLISSSSLVFSGYSQPCLSLETQHFPLDMSSNMDCWELCTSKNVRQTQPPIPGLCILRDNSKCTNGY